MHARDDTRDVDAYRPWAWLAGYAAAGALAAIMFGLSTGFL